MNCKSLFALLVYGASALHVTHDKRFDEFTVGLAKFDNTWTKTHQKRAQAVQALRNASILFYGDSIVEHWSGEAMGAPMYSKKHPKAGKEASMLWKKYFEDRYGPSYASGISGDRISNLLYRLENGESPKNAQPRVILLHIGTNDLSFGWAQNDTAKNIPYKQRADEFFKGYSKLVKKMGEESPHSTIVLTGIFPRGVNWPNNSYEHMIPHMNKLIASLADESTIYYADCSQALIKRGKVSTQYAADFLHPTTSGYTRWAECLQPTLDKILL